MSSKSTTKTAPEIGAIESAGEHKGEIYGGIPPDDNEPIWILEEPEPMTHYNAVKLQGRTLPTSAQGKYIDTIKDKGALKDSFADHSNGSYCTGYFWLAAHDRLGAAAYQRFSNGSRDWGNRGNRMSVLSIRR